MRMYIITIVGIFALAAAGSSWADDSFTTLGDLAAAPMTSAELAAVEGEGTWELTGVPDSAPGICPVDCSIGIPSSADGGPQNSNKGLDLAEHKPGKTRDWTD